MKYIKKILLSTIIILGYIPSIASNCFKLANVNGLIKTVNKVVMTKETISFPFHTERSFIGGLAITGSVVKNNNDYIVRIVLIDKEGHEYLIMESYNAINDKRDFSFESYCEETALLDAVDPDSIKVYVWNAMITINSIQYENTTAKTSDTINFKKKYNDIRREQLAIKVNRINKYNYANNKLWRAGITPLSQKKYEERKRILGFPDEASTGGIEFYSEGIFEVGDEERANNTTHPRNSNFIDEFDWRWHHGKNWITPNKHQGNSGYCHFFTCVACTEALTNLYYNRILNLDLSEQELACCSGINNPYYGVPYSPSYLKKPLDYLVEHGVCDEVAYPFVDSPSETCRSSDITPNELIKIDGYGTVDNTNEDSLKKALIEHGPLISGVRYWGYNSNGTTWHINHSMLIVGFGILQVGDTIYHWVESNGFKDGRYVVKPNDPRVGMTYWIYKNSYGLDGDSARQGYMYIIHYNLAQSMNHTYYAKPPIISMNFSDDEIVCEDSDGDGLYFWGIGDKPAHCPSWVPDTPDGDDSNINYGSMDEYGNLEALPTGITIKTPVTYSSNSSTSYRLGIVDGGKLTITGITSLTGNGKIRVCEGGMLIVDGGTLQNADITMVPGCTVIVRNNGKINMASGKTFETPLGATVTIESGEIN